MNSGSVLAHSGRYQKLNNKKKPDTIPLQGYTQGKKIRELTAPEHLPHLYPEKNYIRFHKNIFKSQNLTELVTFVYIIKIIFVIFAFSLADRERWQCFTCYFEIPV